MRVYKYLAWMFWALGLLALVLGVQVTAAVYLGIAWVITACIVWKEDIKPRLKRRG